MCSMPRMSRVVCYKFVKDKRDCVCWCWETEPFPISDFPDKLPKESRYFHYVHIARLLGATGEKKRAKLPKCVQKRIASMFPDTEGAATKVGYQEAE